MSSTLNPHSFIHIIDKVTEFICFIKLKHSSNIYLLISLVAQTVKHLLTMWETWVPSLGWEDHLEKEIATHSSTLAWKIPWMEESDRLQSMEFQRVGHDWASSLSYTSCHFQIWYSLTCYRKELTYIHLLIYLLIDIFYSFDIQGKCMCS